jgi:membrane protease subunit (stomatin/prohibitin family)
MDIEDGIELGVGLGVGAQFGNITSNAMETDTLSCSYCEKEIEKDSQCCSSCGKSLIPPKCINCKSINPLGSKFCNECGTSL